MVSLSTVRLRPSPSSLPKGLPLVLPSAKSSLDSPSAEHWPVLLMFDEGMKAMREQ